MGYTSTTSTGWTIVPSTMKSRMAPSREIKQPYSGDLSRRAGDGIWAEGVRERNVVSGVGRRQPNDFVEDEVEPVSGGGMHARQEESVRRLNPLGNLGIFEQVASGVSKGLNNILNPTRQASPETTIAVPPVDSGPQTTEPATTTVQPPPAAQPTSQPPPPVPSTSQPAPVAAPSITTPAVSQPIITSVAAVPTIVPVLIPGNPAVAAPVELDTSSLVQKQPLDDMTSIRTSSQTVVGQSSRTASPTSLTLVPNATPTVMTGDQQTSGGSSMAPIAQRLLIAAGVIGVLIAMIVAFLVIIRRRRGETFPMFVRRKSPKYGSKLFPPVRQQQPPPPREEYYPEPPPKYTSTPESYEYVNVEKSVPAQRQMEGFYTPGPLPPLTIPVRAAAPLTSYSPQRQQTQQQVSPMSANRQRTTSPQRQTGKYFIISPQSAQAPPSDLNRVFIENGLYQGPTPASYNSTFITNQSRNNSYDRGDSRNNTFNNVVSPSTQISAGYQNGGTYDTMQTSNLNSGAQQDPNRLSTLSSLSSGFGDGLIIQDTDSIVKYTQPQAQRASRRQQRTTRFSWQTNTSKAPSDDRTSTYTATSVESAPRFRSVNSWVAQQSTRVERQQRMAANIPEMPPVPEKLQQNVAPVKHRRQESDNPAFNYHPGQEIRITPGSRVPSSVLDKRIGHLSKSTLG